MTHPTDPARLSPPDCDALDALVESGFDPARVPPFLRERADRLASMLGLLEPLGSHSETHAIKADEHRGELTLSPADGAALDALVESGWSTSRVSAEHVMRAGLIESLFDLLGAPTAEELTCDRESLLGATMLEIERSDAAQAAGQIVISPHARRLPRFRLADLLSAAAIFLIATSILWPMVTGLRHENMRVANAARMANAGLGFALYANDHQGKMPMAESSYAGRAPGVVWWNVGTPNQSQSAHLFVLTKTGYASLEDLASPTNPVAPIRLDVSTLDDWRTPDEVSYSYQLLGPGLVRWSTPSRQVVLADRSPVIEQARAGVPVNPLLNSFAHRGAGQHVLFNDRSVRWFDSPFTSWGDNIWLPRSLERRLNATLRGNELPDGQDDAFVGP